MENSKYYWIKLRTDYFDQEIMDFLMSQQNGCQYIVLYQMLCLKTANTNGKLINKIGEMIVPYNIEKIVRDTKYFDYDTVVVALELYKKLGLIYVEEDGNLKITDIENMVGSETKWAEKKRIYREKQKMLGQKKDIVREDIRDKILDIRDIDNKEEIYKEESNIFDYYQQEIGSLTPKQYETMNNWLTDYGEERIIQAIDTAVNNNVKTFNYIKACLINWKSGNSINKKEKELPKWMDKEIEHEVANDSEIKEIEDLLKEIKSD